MLIRAEALTALVAEVFRGAGCSAAEADRVASRLVSANLTGHDSHGVSRTPRYVRMLREGVMVADQTAEVVSRTPSHAVVDGRYGLGQTVGEQAVALGIEMAAAGGTAIVGLRNAGHLGRAGDWAEMAADAGLVSIHVMNVRGAALVAPFGGVERRFGTNPIAIGVPRDGEPPLVHDFATSVVAEGKVNVATQGGPAVPHGSLITGDGHLSDDPSALYGPERPVRAADGDGALRAMGEHKGSGLAMMCELLGGALTGSGTVKADRQRFANGMLSIYVSPEAFLGDDGAAWFVDEVRAHARWVSSSRAAAGHDRVLVPGEIERLRADERRREGIDLADGTWAAIVETATSLGVGADAVAAAVRDAPPRPDGPR